MEDEKDIRKRFNEAVQKYHEDATVENFDVVKDLYWELANELRKTISEDPKFSKNEGFFEDKFPEARENVFETLILGKIGKGIYADGLKNPVGLVYNSLNNRLISLYRLEQTRDKITVPLLEDIIDDGRHLRYRKDGELSEKERTEAGKQFYSENKEFVNRWIEEFHKFLKNSPAYKDLQAKIASRDRRANGPNNAIDRASGAYFLSIFIDLTNTSSAEIFGLTPPSASRYFKTISKILKSYPAEDISDFIEKYNLAELENAEAKLQRNSSGFSEAKPAKQSDGNDNKGESFMANFRAGGGDDLWGKYRERVEALFGEDISISVELKAIYSKLLDGTIDKKSTDTAIYNYTTARLVVEVAESIEGLNEAQASELDSLKDNLAAKKMELETLFPNGDIDQMADLILAAKVVYNKAFFKEGEGNRIITNPLDRFIATHFTIEAGAPVNSMLNFDYLAGFTSQEIQGFILGEIESLNKVEYEITEAGVKLLGLNPDRIKGSYGKFFAGYSKIVSDIKNPFSDENKATIRSKLNDTDKATFDEDIRFVGEYTRNENPAYEDGIKVSEMLARWGQSTPREFKKERYLYTAIINEIANANHSKFSEVKRRLSEATGYTEIRGEIDADIRFLREVFEKVAYSNKIKQYNGDKSESQRGELSEDESFLAKYFKLKNDFEKNKYNILANSEMGTAEDIRNAQEYLGILTQKAKFVQEELEKYTNSNEYLDSDDGYNEGDSKSYGKAFLQKIEGSEIRGVYTYNDFKSYLGAVSGRIEKLGDYLEKSYAEKTSHNIGQARLVAEEGQAGRGEKEYGQVIKIRRVPNELMNGNQVDLEKVQEFELSLNTALGANAIVSKMRPDGVSNPYIKVQVEKGNLYIRIEKLPNPNQVEEAKLKTFSNIFIQSLKISIKSKYQFLKDEDFEISQEANSARRYAMADFRAGGGDGDLPSAGVELVAIKSLGGGADRGNN